MSNPLPFLLLRGAGITLILLALLLIYALYTSGQLIMGTGCLLLLLLAIWIYTRAETHPLSPYQYLLPGLVTFGLFVLFPIIYTVSISFTNYGVAHLLTYEGIWDQYFSRQTFDVSEEVFTYEIYESDRTYEILLAAEQNPLEKYRYSNFDPTVQEERVGDLDVVSATYQPAGDRVPIRKIIQWKPALTSLRLELPNGLQLSRTGLRHFQPRQARYQRQEDGTLLDRKTGEFLTPDRKRGFYIDAQGQKVGPGFAAWVGFDQYLRLLTDPEILQPFFRVFLWTLAFSAGSVLLSLGVSMIFAVLLNWESLAFRPVYRSFFILPYAIPAFISILVFRGLFNPDFGEINQLLQHLFDLEPQWFANPWLARGMILLVNTWLSYPYMMLLILGILQSIPTSLYEASVIDGAGPLQHFFSITFPLLLPPLVPILISSFAFAFNNFVLIYLLTGGGPNMLDTSTPVGETDILVSYTYRLAFGQAEADYGFAAAIATVIFAIVGSLALIQLRLTSKRVAQ